MGDFKFEHMDMGATGMDGFLSNPSSGEGGSYPAGALLSSLEMPSTQDFDLQSVQMTASRLAPAIDKVERAVTASRKTRVKVASLSQLEPFIRVSAETLIHRSEKELWTIGKEADGGYYIERLFDDSGSPLKG